MIVGIGVDIARVERFVPWIGDEAMMARYFHPREIEDVRKRGPGGAASLAGRFAAKEAFGKALGTGLRGIRLRDICIRQDDLGKPEFCLFGPARKIVEDRGVTAMHVSLSHDAGAAVAMVVLEG